MLRIRVLTGVLAAAFALAGCGDESPVAPTSGADGAPAAGGGETGIVTVVHGIPGLTVDVYVNGAITLPSFAPGTVTDPLELPEGDYDLAVLPEGGVFPDDAVLTGSTFLPAGANASVVAHLLEGGSPTLSVFVNDVSPTRGIRSRVVVRHLADAPTVDVRLFRRILPWFPVRTIRDLSNPEEAQTEIFPGLLRAKVYPAGSRTSVLSSDFLPFFPNESTIVYAVGSLGGESLGLLVQKIRLPRTGWGWYDDDDAALRDDLTLEEYDEIAVERGLDREEADAPVPVR